MVEIKKIKEGQSFRTYLQEILTEHGKEIADELIDGLSLNIITETSNVYTLQDNFDNTLELKITLREIGE